jgi:hypothetical protein
MIYQFNSLFQSDFCFLYDESHKRPNMGVTGIASMIKVVLHEPLYKNTILVNSTHIQ